MSNNKRTTAILNALAKLPIFRGLSRDQLVKLLTICQKVNFKDSEIIFNQGENSDKLYILVKGAVAILINQVEVAKVAKPSTFGEIGIFLQEKRSATLKVLGEALFMVAPFDKIFSLMASDRILNNRVTRNVVRIISLKIKDNNDVTVNLMNENRSLEGNLVILDKIIESQKKSQVDTN